MSLPTEIEQLVLAGQEKHNQMVAAEREQQQAEEAERAANARIRWDAIEATLLDMLPEVVRPYIQLNRSGRMPATGDWHTAEILIDGLAPILVSFHPDNRKLKPYHAACSDTSAVAGYDYHNYASHISKDIDIVLAAAQRNWPEIEAVQKERAEHKAQEQNYYEAMVDYFQKEDAAKKYNIDLVKEIQQSLAESKPAIVTDTCLACQLEYGIVANNGGDAFMATESVWVLESPGNGRYSVVHHGGKLEAIHIFNPVAITVPKPLPKTHYASYTPKKAPQNQAFCINSIDPEQLETAKVAIEARYNANAKPMPEMPDCRDFGLDPYGLTQENLRGKAYEFVYEDAYW